MYPVSNTTFLDPPKSCPQTDLDLDCQLVYAIVIPFYGKLLSSPLHPLKKSGAHFVDSAPGAENPALAEVVFKGFFISTDSTVFARLNTGVTACQTDTQTTERSTSAAIARTQWARRWRCGYQLPNIYCRNMAASALSLSRRSQDTSRNQGWSKCGSAAGTRLDAAGLHQSCTDKGDRTDNALGKL